VIQAANMAPFAVGHSLYLNIAFDEREAGSPSAVALDRCLQVRQADLL